MPGRQASTAKTAIRSIDLPRLFTFSPEFSRRTGSWEGRQLRASKTSGQMVVDHSNRLHVGVHDGRADETEAATFQVLADRVRYRRTGRHLLHALPAILQRTSVHEAPQIGVERAEFPPHFEEGPRVSDRRFDLEAIAHDSRIGQQSLHVVRAEARDLCGVESRERLAVIVALVQYRRPRESRLCTLEDQELEESTIVVDRDSPFLVVVAEILLASEAPWAAALGVDFIHRSMIPFEHSLGGADLLLVAIDIGGTFTDLMAFDEATGRFAQAKSLTTPTQLVQGIIDCLRMSAVDVAGVSELIHGSTTAINTLIERKGAKTGLIVTRGTRDVYSIGRGNRPESYNLLFRRHRPLVPRHLTREIDERMLASGEVLEPLEHASLEEACRRLADEKVEAVAVCFLHSYINPEHERAAGEIVRRALPGAYVSLSHEILREYREFERTSTTVVNAYIGPQVGGIIASAQTGRALGFADVISFDMGGTTAKASLIREGEPTMAPGYYVGGYASGHPVMVPVIDVVEVGAGGGSIAWIDEIGALKVGPQSAGADPGPICYRGGGTEPTITDANLVLGRLDPDDFLGGQMALDAEAAARGILAKIAGPLAMSMTAAAQAIVDIAVAKMSLAVREVSVAKGYDPP